jgi:hypothetical protein
MGSTTRIKRHAGVAEYAATIRWRTWPLADHAPWSWVALLGALIVGAAVYWLGGGWLLAVFSVAGLAATLWQFLLPVVYELGALGLRHQVLGRSWIVPWYAVRAYQLRPTGVVLYQRGDPVKIDLARSLFVPYPADADEMLCALREHLSHAIELPR